jgi:hypothetical protein
MLNRSSILALTTVAALAAVALAPTDASAMRGFGGRGGGGGGHVSFIGHGPVGGGFGRSFGQRWGHGTRVAVGGIRCHWHYCGPVPVPNPPHCIDHCGGHPPIVWWHHHPHWGVGEYPVPVGDGAVATAAVGTTAGNCNCLTKQYLDDGSVLFKDICSKEAAMATPEELRAQAQGAAPQAQAN